MAKTREDILTDAAIKFAQAYWDRVANRRDKNGNPTAPMVPAEKQAFAKGEDAYVDWMARAMYAKMAADPEYSAENWNEAKAERLEKFDDYKGALYAIQGGPSPEAAHEQNMFATFYPYIKDGAWYNMSPQAITALMNSPEFGYDSSNEKSRQQFWDDLTKYDLLYQRGKIVDEFANSGWGKMNAVLNRTAYKEAMEQALGNKPYSEADVWTGFGIDRGRDMLMAPAMAMRGVVAPALAMGGADMASQYAGAATLGQTEFSPGETLSSMGAGATIIPGFRYGTRWLSRVKNPAVAEFGREMNRGARNYAERDYIAEEANALKQELLNVRKEQQLIRDGKLLPGTPKYDAAMERYRTMEDKLRLLGFNGTKMNIVDNVLQPNALRDYLAQMSSNSFNNNAAGRFITLPTMMGETGGRSTVGVLYALEGAYRSPFTYNVSRPTIDEVARWRAAQMLGINPNVALVAPETLPPKVAAELEAATKSQLEGSATAAHLDQILQQGTERRTALRQAFPAMSKRLEGKDAPKGRTVGSVTGSTVSNTLGLLSGSEGVDLVAAARAAGTIGDDRSVFQDKVDAFKQSDLYRNLPEDRKNVLEAAFKKAAEERKKKGKK